MSFTEAQKREIVAIAGLTGQNRRGLVTSWQPSPPMVRVQFMPLPPTGAVTESGWIPVLSSAVGLSGVGWKLVSPPMNGAQALLVCEEGDGEHYVAVGFYFSDEDPAPQGAQPGEVMFENQDGDQLYLTADGNLVITAGTVTVNGNMTVSGTISATDVIVAGNVSSKNHEHTSETPGTPTSAPIAGT
jgi:phage baseplate assembly protein gpV